MATDAKQAPRVKWGSIVASDKGYHLATMETVNGKPTAQHLGDPVERFAAEEAFRVWAANELFGWEGE
jgi:hypothetical protein